MFNLIHGNLLESEEEVIAHQTNCVIKGEGAGLYRFLIKKYPYAHVYSRRYKDGTPGEITIDFPQSMEGPIVIGIQGQYNVGVSGDHNGIDTHENREKWFAECLEKIDEFMTRNGYTSIGFPYMIGCGLAGGVWKNYERMLNSLAEKGKDVYKVNVYKL